MPRAGSANKRGARLVGGPHLKERIPISRGRLGREKSRRVGTLCLCDLALRAQYSTSSRPLSSETPSGGLLQRDPHALGSNAAATLFSCNMKRVSHCATKIYRALQQTKVSPREPLVGIGEKGKDGIQSFTCWNTTSATLCHWVRLRFGGSQCLMFSAQPPVFHALLS